MGSSGQEPWYRSENQLSAMQVCETLCAATHILPCTRADPNVHTNEDVRFSGVGIGPDFVMEKWGTCLGSPKVLIYWPVMEEINATRKNVLC